MTGEGNTMRLILVALLCALAVGCGAPAEREDVGEAVGAVVSQPPVNSTVLCPHSSMTTSEKSYLQNAVNMWNYVGQNTPTYYQLAINMFNIYATACAPGGDGFLVYPDGAVAGDVPLGEGGVAVTYQKITDGRNAIRYSREVVNSQFVGKSWDLAIGPTSAPKAFKHVFAHELGHVLFGLWGIAIDPQRGHVPVTNYAPGAVPDLDYATLAIMNPQQSSDLTHRATVEPTTPDRVKFCAAYCVPDCATLPAPRGY